MRRHPPPLFLLFLFPPPSSLNVLLPPCQVPRRAAGSILEAKDAPPISPVPHPPTVTFLVIPPFPLPSRPGCLHGTQIPRFPAIAWPLPSDMRRFPSDRLILPRPLPPSVPSLAFFDFACFGPSAPALSLAAQLHLAERCPTPWGPIRPEGMEPASPPHSQPHTNPTTPTPDASLPPFALFTVPSAHLTGFIWTSSPCQAGVFLSRPSPQGGRPL
jgi:hypothetical protein